jgi:drug/metabolite transporter (DMT)-like permease
MIIFLSHLLIADLVQELLTLSLLTIFILILSVTFNIVLGDTLYFVAAKYIGIKIATPIVNLYPITTILLGVYFLGETFQWDFFLGTGLALLGIILLTSENTDKMEIVKIPKDVMIKGILLSLLVVIFYGLGIFFITLGSINVNPIVANCIRMPAATIMLGINTLIMKNKFKSTLPVEKIKHFYPKMLLAGVLGTYLSSYFLVLSSIVLGAGLTAILTAIGPLFALPFAIFWLKENVGLRTLFGTIVTILGVILILM